MTGNKKATDLDAVLNSLKHRIITLAYEPGHVLTEKNVEREYGITRTTLKSIVHRLEQMKLVEMIPRIGIKITEIDFNVLLKDYEVKIYLEKMAVTLATRHISRDEIRQIGEWIDQLAGSYESFPDVVDIDLQIHNTIYKNSRNDTLIHFLDILQSRVLRMIVSLFSASELLLDEQKPGLVDFRKFHEMLVERNEKKASEYFVSHSISTFNAIREKLASESYY